jgi:hypothetical protein
MHNEPLIQQRFICGACFETVKRTPGEHCGLPLLSLADPAMVELVREHADRILERQKRAENLIIWSGASVLVIGVAIVLLIRYDFQLDDVAGYAAGVLPAVGIALGQLHARVFKGSARAILAARRTTGNPLPAEMRLVDEEPHQHDIARTAGVDPRALPLPALLSWIGAKDEG